MAENRVLRMLELSVVPVRSKYQVEDTKGRLLYTIKRKWRKYAILDANDYELYVLADPTEDEYRILLNNKRKASLRCLSKFVHPKLELSANGKKLIFATEDRMHYTITTENGEERGEFEVVTVAKDEYRFDLKIAQVDFDDYVPLIPLAAINSITPVS